MKHFDANVGHRSSNDVHNPEARIEYWKSSGHMSRVIDTRKFKEQEELVFWKSSVVGIINNQKWTISSYSRTVFSVKRIFFRGVIS